MHLSEALALVVSLSAVLAIYNYLRRRRTLPLPPGPKRLPLIGNLFDVPTTYEYETFAKWTKEYGDVIYLSVLGKDMVILNSDTAAKELLDSRSAIYSDRPYIPVMHEPRLFDQNYTFVLRRYGPEWRRERRLFSQYLGRTALQAYQENLMDAAQELLRFTLQDPDEFSGHLRHSTTATVLSIAYGYQIQKKNDPFVALGETVNKLLAPGVLPGRFLVNIFPWMKYIPSWMPGAGFKKYAAEAKEVGRRLIEVPFEDAQRRIAEGKAKPSLVASSLADSSKPELVTIAKNVASTMLGAGADTTYSGLLSCVLALVLYPEIQLRAHAELDKVIGPATSPAFRLPTFADRQKLPYIDAIVLECLRWIPIVPLAIPHGTTEEDVYRGWRIPKGSTVILNAWMMLRNPDTYSDPLEFRPERFLGDNPDPHPMLHGCFGFGRRECPGRYIAESALWINIANYLAAFTFSPAKDKEGRVIDVNYARDAASGLILLPRAFPCIIRPRSRETEARILESHTGNDS